MIWAGFLPEEAADPLGHGELPLPGSSGGVMFYRAATHPEMLDQGQSETCVANAVARAFRDLVGGDELPSRAWIYRYGRGIGGREQEKGGMRFSEAVSAISRFGVPPERFWPFDPDEINEDPSYEGPLDAVKHAHDQKHELLMHPLWPDQIRSALLDGYQVVTAFEVDDAFSAGVFDEPWSLANHTGSYHAVQVIGFRPGEFLIANSYGLWGPSDDGICRVSDKTVRDGMGSFVVRRAPGYRGQL